MVEDENETICGGGLAMIHAKHQLSSAETTTSQPLPRSIKPSFFSSSNLRPPSRSKEPFTAPPHMNNKLLIEEADRERNQ
ncbi:hypothetical protein E3N88_03334 [Mikania micrantha]|uniref:Uncharacterized protein n=1 Tax=Mikania micrantha TaxID=192012 RepID=A0A5N6Q8J4_9ASTR|nr:hypothetical protein E3N88_03334 [Mikania micrantha]